MAVVTVGSIHAGLKNNIIPAEAKLELSLRYPNDEAREKVLAKVERVVRAEAVASGATEEPIITTDHTLPPTINDAGATARLVGAFTHAYGDEHVVDPGMFTGSEDVSWFARDAGVPLVFWFWEALTPPPTRPRAMGNHRPRHPHQSLTLLRSGPASHHRARCRKPCRGRARVPD